MAAVFGSLSAVTPLAATLLAFAAYALAYRWYARYLADRIFRLDPSRATPAQTLEDGIDYVPTAPSLLFSHHFASITGLAPMLGPAVAVIWGWAPALCWVVLGAIFVGCVHDMAAMVVSLRTRGLSVGEVAGAVLGPKARTLMHLVIFFGVALAMGVFVYVLARLFSVELAPGHAGYPQAVLPSAGLVVVSFAAGLYLRRHPHRLIAVGLVGFAIELVLIHIGNRLPTFGLPPAAWPDASAWTWALLGYAFAASVLPVWALLQPRDFLNALLLYLGLGLAYVGLLLGDHRFAAPALRLDPPGAPPLLPFMLIVVACGAASGFHGLVASGTTAKQMAKETHARPVGYGAMIGESLLGLLATMACTAGVASPETWHDAYADWSRVQALPRKIDAFIQGTTTFLGSLGIPHDAAAALVAMVVVSFALTTLDSATRLLRFNIEEIGASFGLRAAGNRYVASALACGIIGVFAFYEVDVTVGGQTVRRPAGLALWQLFGTTNQLLAGLTLLVVTVYLRARGRPTWPVAIPAVVMLASTLSAMVTNLLRMEDPLLLTVGSMLLLLGIGVVFFAGSTLWRPAPPSNADDSA
ncbi:MAG: carbon starvation protein A [Deltaproteobacteria bacterium]|nr:MAG: carbon starvation protein A [Deltaproteobacteria bacterium]